MICIRLAACVIEGLHLKGSLTECPSPSSPPLGLKARDELLMTHELKPEVTGVVDEEETVAEADLLYDIVSEDRTAVICFVLPSWH